LNLYENTANSPRSHPEFEAATFHDGLANVSAMALERAKLKK
jgi:hypothetical protein